MTEQTIEKDAAAKFGETVESLLVSSFAFVFRIFKTLFHTVFYPNRLIESLDKSDEPKYVRPFTYLAIGALALIVCHKNQDFYAALLGDASLVASFQELGNTLSPWQMITQSLPVIACVLLLSFFLTFLFPRQQQGANGSAIRLLCYCASTQMLLLFSISIGIAAYAMAIKYLVASQLLDVRNAIPTGILNNSDPITKTTYWLGLLAVFAPIPVLFSVLYGAKNSESKTLKTIVAILALSLLIALALRFSSYSGAHMFHSFSDAKQLASQNLIDLGDRELKSNTTVVFNSVQLNDGQIRFQLFLHNPHDTPLTLLPSPKLVWLSWNDGDTKVYRPNLDIQGNVKNRLDVDPVFFRVNANDTNWIDLEFLIPNDLTDEIQWPLKFVIQMPRTDGSVHWAKGEILKPAAMRNPNTPNGG